MKLYYAPGACSMASHICLEETGVPYETYAVNTQRKEHKGPEYLRINKHGQIPALAVDDTVIVENVAIQYYLASRYREAGLKPMDLMEEARWLSFISWMASTVHVSAKHITRTYIYTDDEAAHDSIRRVSRDSFWTYLVEIDRTLADNQWILGDQFTTADAYVLPYLNGAIKFGMPVDDLANLRAWQKRMLNRKAVRVVLEREGNTLLAGAAVAGGV
jgi:glutathione S-transferase